MNFEMEVIGYGQSLCGGGGDDNSELIRTLPAYKFLPYT